MTVSMGPVKLERQVALELVRGCVVEALAMVGAPEQEVTEATVLVGPGTAIDSIAIVSLVVDVEQKLEQDHRVSVTLANDKAMSAKNSPFRTVGVLTDYVLELAAEGLPS
jgi:acyl carrier protein